MSPKIEELKALGTFGKTLAAANIVSTEDLLERCSNAEGRVTTAAETGIKETELLKLANLADMMRIPGVNGQFAELLEAAGIGNIRDLRTRSAAALVTRFQEINDKKKIVKSLPTSSTVQVWIDRAKATEPRVF
jgi:hypothetical protein